MTIRSMRVNRRRGTIDLEIDGRDRLCFPWSRLEPAPQDHDRVAAAEIDGELADEAVSFRLESGGEGVLHQDQVLDYHRGPGYLRDMLLHRLTAEAIRRVETSDLGVREIAQRMHTSPAQLYRLLDPSHTGKTVDAMIGLLQVVDARVELRVL